MALDYLPSPSWAVIYGETPSATRWSELGENDDSLATGAGIDDLAILTRHLANDAVTPEKMAFDFVNNVLAANFATSSTSYVDSGVKVTLPAIGIWLLFAQVRGLTASAGQFGVMQLFNQTTGISLPDTERLNSYGAGANERMNTTIVVPITTTTVNNILRVNFKSGGAYTNTIESDPNGKTQLLALRVG